MAENPTHEEEQEEEEEKGANGTAARAKKRRPDTRRLKGIVRSLKKPSYTLATGGGAGKIRAVNRIKLRRILRRLVRRHNWAEASGVLSVLLIGTSKDKSHLTNRNKFLSAIEIRKHLDGDSPSTRQIQNVFEVWMKKIGSMKKWPLKDRFVVLMEYILFCLGQGDVEPADQTATCLMEEREFGKDPDSNMMVGITFCELWNSAIPVKFRSRVSDESHSSGESEMSETNYDASAQNSEENQFTAISENGSSFRPDSETSVRIGKDFGSDANNNENRPISMDVDDDPGKETSHVHSSMTSDDEDSSYSYKKDNMQYTYTFNGPGFESWLMPVKLYSIKKLENSISSHALKEYYKGAIKHLRVALYSSPPLYEALLPLVQMLVLGNYIDEALNELDQFGHSSQMVLPLRAKATILENIDGKNYWKLSACYEEILKKDPLCGDSLAKLISLHHRGEYDLQQLLEMIALHLEASYPDSDIWKEFASCFMNLCRCEDDRMSCIGNNDSEIKQGDLISMKTVPEIFTKGKSGKTWKKRCRWWLYRHFSQTILSSEIEAGSLQLLAYKAASASHMYGPEVEYVVKASAHLEDKDRILYSFLQNHMQENDDGPSFYNFLLSSEKLNGEPSNTNNPGCSGEVAEKLDLNLKL